MTTTSNPTNQGSSSPLGNVSQMAQSIFTKENVASVGEAVGQQAGELKALAEDGDHSLRLLAMLGGLALMVVAGMEFTSKLLTFKFAAAIIEFFSFVIGIMIILLESKNLTLSNNAQAYMFRYALFLKFLWGRGALYFFIGIIQLHHLDIWTLIVGGYLCCLGLLMIFVGQRTAYKLKQIRKSLFSAAELQAKFAQSDLDGDGGLNVQQFRNLTMSLGLDMTRRETEAAFNHIHKSQTEKLTYDEFHQWWTNTDVEENINENALSFV
eukprot:Nitzschia sp. Nitz4//scaffold62_size106224//81132//81932//NITZ4_004366-RA/size106224-processed-gene-0.37-mRNA-1//1//CDS//3329555886//8247//frame0